MSDVLPDGFMESGPTADELLADMEAERERRREWLEELMASDGWRGRDREYLAELLDGGPEDAESVPWRPGNEPDPTPGDLQ